jgi:hypothetical protein
LVNPQIRETARRYHTIQIQVGGHTITAADPIPDDFRHTLNAINGSHLPAY